MLRLYNSIILFIKFILEDIQSGFSPEKIRAQHNLQISILIIIKNVNTRSRVAPLFKTVIPSCEKYKNGALYHGAILWNMLPVNIRNIDSFDSFKVHQKKAMTENG